MLRKLSGLLAVGLAGAAGCAQFHHHGYETALRCGADHPIGPLQRSQVHLFLLNGLDPTEDAQLYRLRDELNRAGYAMIHLVERHDTAYVRRELHRLRRDQPMSQLVLGGFGASADAVRALACTVSGEGVPVAAVVLLDPTCAGPELVADGLPLTVIRSPRWPGGRNLATEDVTEIGGVGHLGLPSHPLTVAAVLRVLDGAATHVTLEPPGTLPHLPMTDFPQPPPRPVVPVIVPPPVAEK